MSFVRNATSVGFSFALFVVVGAAAAGVTIGASFLHPGRRALTPSAISSANNAFREVGAQSENFDVKTSDGTLLRGWKVHPASANGDWVVLFHGVADNRIGTLAYAEMLLRHGYGVVMMDARAHGESEGSMATYGWLERDDSRSIDDALFASDDVRHLFYLGESMGAAIALQSAAVDPRVAGVVAESSFANLREVTYDYAGLDISPLLGKTLFRPATMMALADAEKEGSFSAQKISPEKAVAQRLFPVFLICDAKDRRIPCRHSRRIYNAAAGPKEIWVVPGAGHTMAFGTHPVEFESRVIGFFERIASQFGASH
ncbi:MAG TPA: alpha/beta fold hydrolase [Candidatus Acidoferrales bacterium]